MKSLLLIAWSGLSINILSANSLNNLLKKPPQWFQSTEAKNKLSNILSFQDATGIWPKNVNTAGYRYDGLQSKLQGTFDNSASLNELGFWQKRTTPQKIMLTKSIQQRFRMYIRLPISKRRPPQSPMPRDILNTLLSMMER